MAEQEIAAVKARAGRSGKQAKPPQPSGHGLRLALELTQLHGGTLDIASTIGAGTTVTIDLPAERCVQHADHA
jgi:signal transduction histidine kinase